MVGFFVCFKFSFEFGDFVSFFFCWYKEVKFGVVEFEVGVFLLLFFFLFFFWIEIEVEECVYILFNVDIGLRFKFYCILGDG